MTAFTRPSCILLLTAAVLAQFSWAVEPAYEMASFQAPAPRNASKASPAYPRLDVGLNRALESQEELVAAALGGFMVANDRVQVHIHTTEEAVPSLASWLEREGAEAISSAYDVVQAHVSPATLPALDAHPDVIFVRKPHYYRPSPDDQELTAGAMAGSMTTEALAAMNVPAWHSAGIRGQGVKVGIIDAGFKGYSSYLGTDLPPSSKVFVWSDGASRMENSVHGLMCAEIVTDIAPDMDGLYLAAVSTTVDQVNATTWMRTNGVKVITMSLGWLSWGPGDGTGMLADNINSFVAAGGFWANSAGNSRLAHWQGNLVDSDGDGWLEFDGTGREINYVMTSDRTGCRQITAGTRINASLIWNQWTSPQTDLDFYILKWNATSNKWEEFGKSDNLQNGQSGQLPIEENFDVWEADTDGCYGFAVQHYSGPTNVQYEFFNRFDNNPLVVNVQEGSLTPPSDAASAVASAAVNVTNFDLEPYSSKGPTNGPGGALTGGTVKPDLAGFAKVSCNAYGAGACSGTSSASPHVAGAAALVRSGYPSYTGVQARTYLETNAVDQGAAGKDTDYGYGRVRLGSPPSGGGGGSCGTYITTEDNENNAGTGTADGDMGVSGKSQSPPPCLYNTNSLHPIEFNIFVTGPLPTSSAQLFLETWDVDYPDEINDVYFNNTKVGSTTGANGQWSNPSFNIPLNLVRAGKNTVKLMVDTLNSGRWCTWVAQAQLIIDGGCQGSASCRYVNTNKTSYAPGENVQVTYEIDTTKTSQEIRVESNLKNPSGQIVAGMEKIYTTTGSGNDPQTVTLALPAGAPGGTYRAEILVFDKATGVLESTCFKEFTVTGGGGGAGCTLSCSATVPVTALVGQTVTFNGSATASGCTGAIEYFWFFGDGTTAVAQTQNATYTYSAAGTYSWELVAVVQGNVVCRRTGTITITTSSGGCALGCSATVPATGLVGQTISFQGSASLSGCSGSAEYFWFFGDGTTAVGQAQNTTWVYTQPGTYTWELVVVVGQTICRRSGTIIITGTVGTGCTVGCTALVPATGQVGVPVSFRSFATTSNCQNSPEYFWSFGDGTTAVAQAQNTTYSFPAPGVYRWQLTVVVGGVTCIRTGTITIRGSSGCTLSCTALVPAVAQVDQSVTFRGFVSWSRCSGPPAYLWDFGDRTMPAGGSTPSHTYRAPGSYMWQMTTMVDGVYCVQNGTIVVPGGGASPPPAGCAYSTWFQVGSRASGAAGSQWRTDVFILNRGSQTAAVTARLHTSTGIRTLNVSVPAGQHLTVANIVGQMGHTGSAALELCSNQPVRAASRTYNQRSATETFGQYYRAFTTPQALAAGDTGWLLGLKENSQFRSNVALTNSGTSTARVAVMLYEGNGALVAAYIVTLAPNEWKQENRPFFNKGGRSNIDEGYARVVVLSGSGVEASASAVDAGTGDPVTLPALP